MRKVSIFGAILSAAMITAAGVALAAETPPVVDSGTSGVGSSGMNQAIPAAPGPTSPGMSSDATVPPALPTESLVGKDVINTEGDKIGEVSKIVGDQLVVEVGGFLGMGSHDVALAWKLFKATGSGDDVKLQTTLTKDEIASMPEYKE